MYLKHLVVLFIVLLVTACGGGSDGGSGGGSDGGSEQTSSVIPVEDPALPQAEFGAPEIEVYAGEGYTANIEWLNTYDPNSEYELFIEEISQNPEDNILSRHVLDIDKEFFSIVLKPGTQYTFQLRANKGDTIAFSEKRTVDIPAEALEFAANLMEMKLDQLDYYSFDLEEKTITISNDFQDKLSSVSSLASDGNEEEVLIVEIDDKYYVLEPYPSSSRITVKSFLSSFLLRPLELIDVVKNGEPFIDKDFPFNEVYSHDFERGLTLTTVVNVNHNFKAMLMVRDGTLAAANVRFEGRGNMTNTLVYHGEIAKEIPSTKKSWLVGIKGIDLDDNDKFTSNNPNFQLKVGKFKFPLQFYSGISIIGEAQFGGKLDYEQEFKSGLNYHVDLNYDHGSWNLTKKEPALSVNLESPTVDGEANFSARLDAVIEHGMKVPKTLEFYHHIGPYRRVNSDFQLTVRDTVRDIYISKLDVVSGWSCELSLSLFTYSFYDKHAYCNDWVPETDSYQTGFSASNYDQVTSLVQSKTIRVLADNPEHNTIDPDTWSVVSSPAGAIEFDYAIDKTNSNLVEIILRGAEVGEASLFVSVNQMDSGQLWRQFIELPFKFTYSLCPHKALFSNYEVESILEIYDAYDDYEPYCRVTYYSGNKTSKTILHMDGTKKLREWKYDRSYNAESDAPYSLNWYTLYHSVQDKLGDFHHSVIDKKYFYFGDSGREYIYNVLFYEPVVHDQSVEAILDRYYETVTDFYDDDSTGDSWQINTYYKGSIVTLGPVFFESIDDPTTHPELKDFKGIELLKNNSIILKEYAYFDASSSPIGGEKSPVFHEKAELVSLWPTLNPSKQLSRLAITSGYRNRGPHLAPRTKDLLVGNTKFDVVSINGDIVTVPSISESETSRIVYGHHFLSEENYSDETRYGMLAVYPIETEFNNEERHGKIVYGYDYLDEEQRSHSVTHYQVHDYFHYRWGYHWKENEGLVDNLYQYVISNSYTDKNGSYDNEYYYIGPEFSPKSHNLLVKRTARDKDGKVLSTLTRDMSMFPKKVDYESKTYLPSGTLIEHEKKVSKFLNADDSYANWDLLSRYEMDFITRKDERDSAEEGDRIVYKREIWRDTTNTIVEEKHSPYCYYNYNSQSTCLK